ncbi:unnamed protein product, partial [Discosporangium mesarthrocarpum]
GVERAVAGTGAGAGASVGAETASRPGSEEEDRSGGQLGPEPCSPLRVLVEGESSRPVRCSNVNCEQPVRSGRVGEGKSLWAKLVSIFDPSAPGAASSSSPAKSSEAHTDPSSPSDATPPGGHYPAGELPISAMEITPLSPLSPDLVHSPSAPSQPSKSGRGGGEG